MKVIVIGRHQLSGEEGLEVVKQVNINFPATSAQCRLELYKILQNAIKEGAALVFQMMPGQLAIACANIVGQDPRYKIGAIINRPGERLAGQVLVTKDRKGIKEAVRFANPRAKIETNGDDLAITVDPPLRFEFSHIEWF